MNLMLNRNSLQIFRLVVIGNYSKKLEYNKQKNKYLKLKLKKN